ncbi:Ger(x)C family spore germination protein [Paenibacillus prosopidis]|uniref:Spore germination protein KC n=1 Tax=Paenibacillus prosopidis TaxID=630520 RepID=A0A368VU13_9BACL|nr:Ger(x)C family spore germination protein [Paenibacillus prosopidis]RCW43466.1 spore germination protein KC [Paenibacillus prosopidis]
MKKLFLVLVVLLNPLFLVGCWDRIEINDIAVVTGLGIDQKNEKTIELTAEMYIPKALGGGGGGSGGGGGPQTYVRIGEGNTIADAISNLQEKIPREVFWGQTKVIVIGEKLAKEGIRVTLDFLTRHTEPRLRAHVFVAKGKAKDVLALHPPLERSPSEVLRELAKMKILMDVTLMNLLQMLSGDAQAAAIPMVHILPPQKGMEPLQTIAYINQTAIFRKDKMVGQISDKLTRGVLWFRNEIKLSNITIKPKEGKGYVSSTLLRANSQLIPKIEGGKWRITLKAVTEDDVIVNGSNLNLMNPKFIQMLEKDLEKEIEHRLTQTLEKVQKEMKVDILGFSEEFQRKYPKEWKKVKKNWDEIFPSVEVTYDIKAFIRRPGMSTTPQGLPEDEVKQK